MKKLLLLSVVVISLVFTLSCVNKEVPVTETYYETEYKTEYKTETYTEIEDVVVNKVEGKLNLNPVSEWYSGTLYFLAAGSGVRGLRYYGYEIDPSSNPNSQIKITLSSTQEGAIGVYDLTSTGQISEDEILNSLKVQNSAIVFKPLIAGEFKFDAKDIKRFGIFVNSWNAYAVSNVQLVWSDDVIERKTVTKERQVPYQVPIQVEKQRVVMKTEKLPIWETWSSTETEPTMPSISSISDNENSVEIVPVNDASSETIVQTSLPQPLYEDTFNDPASGFTSLLNNTASTAVYKDGEYHIIVNNQDWFEWKYNIGAGIFSNFIYEIDANLVNGSNRGFYGIIFRTKDNDNFYYVQISAGGGYLIGERFNGNWITLQPWTTSEYINKDFTRNHLRVSCSGPTIDININGNYLASIDDPFNRFTSGYVGMIVYSPAGKVHVAFDNLKVCANQ
jgi:hypothetical protein